MAKLAIKGHETRGKEVIEILEMLGGNVDKKMLSTASIGDVLNPHVYFFDPDSSDNRIVWYYLLGLEADGRASEMIILTLEEFLEKYPFKVGDKVTLDNKLCSIIWMCWECNNVYYQVQGIDDVFTKKVTADELNPYKERNNMGKKLAIKGHPTRGEEVIQLLEMLGGTNDYFKHDGKIENFYYYIGNNNHIYQCGLPSEMKCFTLEEFEKKFPYKVGDTVACYVGIILEKEAHKIIGMQWDSNKCRILYHLDNFNVIEVEDILYSIECKMEQPKQKRIKNMDSKNYNTATIKYIQENGSRDMELIIPCNQEIVNIDGRYILRDKKPQYPKTYKECCECLSLGEDSKLYTKGYKASLIQDFQKLIICRDAYWKIAGEYMGLDKPWEPDWDNLSTNHEFVKINKGCFTYSSRVLVFPTAEMRDVFYEYFKELIEECKELL